MRSFIVYLFFSLVSVSAFAQKGNPYNTLWGEKDTSKQTFSSTETKTKASGTVQVSCPPLLQEVMHYRVNWLDSVNTTVGFRVQIYAASGPNSKSLAREKSNSFKMFYENVNVYVISSMPYFKVRVGDFKTRMQALGFLAQIKEQYPQSFVVTDEVNLR